MAFEATPATIRNLPFWPHLDAAQRELLAGAARRVHFRAGEAVRSGEENCLGILLLETGVLRVYLLAEDGREATIYRLRGGDTCLLAASCMLSAITFDVQIDAETDCDVVLIPASVYASLMEQNLYVENYTYKTTAARLSDVVSAMERMFFLTLRQRVAAFLLDEAAAQHSELLQLTQEQLARAIGSAREAVSRTLKQLGQEGLLEVSRGGVRLLDKPGLYRLLQE